jgi:hypothetical protein
MKFHWNTKLYTGVKFVLFLLFLIFFKYWYLFLVLSKDLTLFCIIYTKYYFNLFLFTFQNLYKYRINRR